MRQTTLCERAKRRIRLRDAKKEGGLVGAAHAATLGLRPTGIADAALGALDFWEIGNVGRWVLDQWYRLMNCGIMLPPTSVDSARGDRPICKIGNSARSRSTGNQRLSD